MEPAEDYFDRLINEGVLNIEGPLPYTLKEFKKWGKYRNYNFRVKMPRRETAYLRSSDRHNLEKFADFFAPEDNVEAFSENVQSILEQSPFLTEIEKRRSSGGWIVSEGWLMFAVEFKDIVPSTSSVTALREELKRALIYAKVEQKASVLLCTQVELECILDISDEGDYEEWLHGTVSVQYGRVMNEIYYAPDSFGSFETRLRHLAKKPLALRAWAEELDLLLLSPEESVRVMSDEELMPYAIKRPWYKTINLLVETLVVQGRRELVRRLREIEREVIEDRSKLLDLQAKAREAEGDYRGALSFLISSFSEKTRYWPEDTDLAFLSKKELGALYLLWLERQPKEVVESIVDELGIPSMTRAELERSALEMGVRREKSDARLRTDLQQWTEDRYLEQFF